MSGVETSSGLTAPRLGAQTLIGLWAAMSKRAGSGQASGRSSRPAQAEQGAPEPDRRDAAPPHLRVPVGRQAADDDAAHRGWRRGPRRRRRSASPGSAAGPTSLPTFPERVEVDREVLLGPDLEVADARERAGARVGGIDEATRVTRREGAGEAPQLGGLRQPGAGRRHGGARPVRPLRPAGSEVDVEHRLQTRRQRRRGRRRRGPPTRRRGRRGRRGRSRPAESRGAMLDQATPSRTRSARASRALGHRLVARAPGRSR